jgi:hypothetical protein
MAIIVPDTFDILHYDRHSFGEPGYSPIIEDSRDVLFVRRRGHAWLAGHDRLFSSIAIKRMG